MGTIPCVSVQDCWLGIDCNGIWKPGPCWHDADGILPLWMPDGKFAGLLEAFGNERSIAIGRPNRRLPVRLRLDVSALAIAALPCLQSAFGLFM